MSNSMKAMLAGAALAGLLTGTTAKLQAQTTNQNECRNPSREHAR